MRKLFLRNSFRHSIATPRKVAKTFFKPLPLTDWALRNTYRSRPPPYLWRKAATPRIRKRYGRAKNPAPNSGIENGRCLTDPGPRFGHAAPVSLLGQLVQNARPEGRVLGCADTCRELRT